MFTRSLQIFLVFAIVFVGYTSASAQRGADNRPAFGAEQDDSQHVSRSFRETRERMRIEREEKDHNEMLERGDEVHKMAIQVERSFEQNGRLSEEDHAVLEALEKKVKKIRSQLGGDDDSEDLASLPLADAVHNFTSVTDTFLDELKKTNRFTISATAVENANAVIRLARLLREH